MKSIIIFALIFTSLLIVTSATAQEEKVLVTITVISNHSYEITETILVEAQMSDWFSGQVAPSQEASFNVSQKRSLVPNKKEMYLQSGFSNRTLLIRSLLKKADSYLNGMA